MKYYVLPLVLWLAGLNLYAQNMTVSGKVTSFGDEEPLIGVNVTVMGSLNGTITDFEGMYSLENVNPSATLEFSYVGYENKRISVNAQSVINVSLSAGTVLNEAVITALGISKDKKVLGYGSQKIGADDLMQSSQPNVVNALQGKVAGVTINSSSGAPGAGASINIRGINSLSGGNNNEPLIVVDGIIISNATNAGNVLPSAGSNALNSNEQFMNSNRLADVNMNDIESVNILKGAAATALYGQRAANGAVIITTKKGQSGTSRVQYDFSYGLQDVAQYPEIQTDYIEGFTGAITRAPSTVFWQWGPQASSDDKFYNHFKEFFRTGTSSNHSLSFSGGTQKTNFQSSFSYLNNEGIVPNSDFNRLTARLAGSHQVNEKLRVGAQVNYANSKMTSPASGDKSIFSSLSFWMPSYDVNDYINDDGTPINPTRGIIDNPRYVAEFSPQTSDVNRVFGDINLNYNINSWLTAKYQLTADYYNDSRVRVVPNNIDLGTQVGGFVTEQNIFSKEINSNLFLTGVRQLNENLGLTVTLGNTITDISGGSLGARGEGFVAPGFNNIRNTTNQFIFKNNSLQRIVGVFADARLDVNNYLYFTVTGRNDWSSTLPEQNRSFFYPSASVAYILTNSILEETDFLNYAKLRASWAQVGKDALPYSIGNYFSPTPGFPFGNIGGFTRDNVIGDPNLKPEITSEYEIGIETNLWNNRIYLEANYFERQSMNQILGVGVSNATGYSSYITNAGVITNRGVELLLGVKPLKTGPFKWDIDFNWTRIRGKVESLPDDLREITYVSANAARAVLRIEEGGAVGDLYGFDWERNDNGRPIIGADGLPILDQTRQVRVGNALPDWLGGMNNTFSYKGFMLNVLLEIRHGGDVFDLGEMNAIRNGTPLFTGTRNVRVVWDGVTADGQPNTQDVVMDQDIYRLYRINAHYSYNLQNASWFRIRNANLSYNLPKNVIGSKIQSVRVGVSGHNLFLSTPFRGYDPEGLSFGSGSNLIGFTGRNAPNVRSINFNISVGF